MLLNITSAQDPKQQQQARFCRSIEGDSNCDGTVGHFQWTSGNNNNNNNNNLYRSLQELLLTSSSTRWTSIIVWFDEEETFACPKSHVLPPLGEGNHRPIQKHYTVFTTDDDDSASKPTEDWCIWGPCKIQAANVAVCLACGHSEWEEEEDGDHNWTVRLTWNASSSFSSSVLTTHQFQRILRANRHGQLEFWHFPFAKEQIKAIWTCDVSLNHLGLHHCSISSSSNSIDGNWGLDCWMQQQLQSFGRLELMGASLFVGHETEWIRFAQHLQERTVPLLNVLSIDNMGSTEALEFLRVKQNGIRCRLYLQDCFHTTEDFRLVAHAVQQGHTHDCLRIVRNVDYAREGYGRHVLDPHDRLFQALTAPQCSLTEFGMELGYSWLDTVRHKFVQTLSQNTSLRGLILEGPHDHGWFHNRKLAQILLQKTRIRRLIFHQTNDSSNWNNILPTLRYLMESDRHFQIELVPPQFSAMQTRAWKEALQPIERFQQVWRFVCDTMPQTWNNGVLHQYFHLVLLLQQQVVADGRLDNPNAAPDLRYRTKLIGLLLSKHMTVLHSSMEAKLMRRSETT